MQRYSPQQDNEVWNKIQATAENNKEDGVLRNHVKDIAKELADMDAFDLVDGRWVLSDRAWTDWLLSGGDKKYLN